MRRDRVAVRGVTGSSVVFRRFCAREVFGAGVKSSSSLSFITLLTSSSSEDSTTACRRCAARRAGRVGDTADIVNSCLSYDRTVCIFCCRCCADFDVDVQSKQCGLGGLALSG